MNPDDLTVSECLAFTAVSTIPWILLVFGIAFVNGSEHPVVIVLGFIAVAMTPFGILLVMLPAGVVMTVWTICCRIYSSVSARG